MQTKNKPTGERDQKPRSSSAFHVTIFLHIIEQRTHDEQIFKHSVVTHFCMPVNQIPGTFLLDY